MRARRTIVLLTATVPLTAALLAAPAYANVAVTPATCFVAQTQLANDQHALAVAQDADRSDDNGAVNGATDVTPDSADLARGNAQATVNYDQDYVNALCATVTPTPIPTPAPIIGITVPPVLGVGTPPPVVVYKYIHGQKCKCTNGGPCTPVPTPTPTPTPAPPTTVVSAPPTVVIPAPVTEVVSPPAPVVISPPAPIISSGDSFGQVGGSAPVGAAPTGDGSLAALVS